MGIIADFAEESSFCHSFCAIGGGGELVERIQKSGSAVSALGKKTSIPSPAAILALARHMRKTRPQIVHLHGAEANFHGAISARLAGVPTVIAEEIGMPSHSRKARLVFREIYRRCDAVVAISDAVKESIVSLGEASPNHVTVIHNPFALQEFRPVPPRTAGFRVGFVGRLEEVKNPIAAVEAVALLKARGQEVFLRIVGDGTQRGLLEARIAELGIGDFVELVGFHPSPFDILRDCHIYLQPSLTEGFGLAICEAMSAGLPVLASAVGGAPEIIEQDVSGWLLDRPLGEDIADMIERIAECDTETLTMMGRRARQSVMSRFSPDLYINKCDNLYSRFLNCS